MNERFVNIAALTDVFLTNKKGLDEVDEFYIRLNYKNGDMTETQTNKDSLVDSLVSVFDNDVSALKSVEVFYMKNDKKEILNGITIF